MSGTMTASPPALRAAASKSWPARSAARIASTLRLVARRKAHDTHAHLRRACARVRAGLRRTHAVHRRPACGPPSRPLRTAPSRRPRPCGRQGRCVPSPRSSPRCTSSSSSIRRSSARRASAVVSGVRLSAASAPECPLVIGARDLDAVDGRDRVTPGPSETGLAECAPQSRRETERGADREQPA